MFWMNYEKLCKEKGMSPNAVAKELSIASGTVTEWKKGKRTPQNATLKKIAEYFNVSVNYLLEGGENLSLLNTITQLIKEKGYTIAKVEKELDFGNGAIRRWDTSSPSCDKLVKLADFLNVSVDYLLGRTDIKEKALPEKEEPNAAAKRLMELYNELNTEGQEKLVSYADDLVTSGKYSTFKIYRAAHSDTNNPAEIKNVGKEFVKALEEAPETDEKF